MRTFLILILAFFAASTFAAPAPARLQKRLRMNPNTVITTADGVTDLVPEDAALRIPVKIRGVITYLSAQPSLMYVQDETGGVCVVGARDRELRLQLKPGAVVEVEGVTSPGRTVAFITNKQKDPLRIVVVGEAPLPAARPVSFRELTLPHSHGELIEVTGVVRSLKTESLSPGGQLDTLIITLASPEGERLDAALLNWHAANPQPAQLVGATVRLRGVFNSAAPDRQPFAANRLLFQTIKEVKVELAAAPAFDLPIASISALRQADAEHPAPIRARVKGMVTLPLAGKGLYLEAADGAIWIEMPPADLKAGDRVDAVGFPSHRGAAVIFEDAIWKVEGHGALPEPPLITPAQALEPAMDSRLVRMEALVLEVSRLSEGPTVVLQSADRVFLARLVDSAGLPALQSASWVRLTGVCLHNRLPAGAAGAAGSGESEAASPLAMAQPRSFHLLMGSTDAVDVIHGPSWWALRRVLAICGALALVASVAIAWVALLRLRVARQTATIRSHLARETLYEERVRIARELHDSLEQDLLGISMQLNATEKLLARPDRAREALHLAAAMVRRSQTETHRAVWDLRDNRDSQEGLIPKLLDAVAGLRPGAAAQIDVHVTGEARPLSADMENHLLRLSLEAVTNALKHAQAARIAVELGFEPDEVRVCVKDDGKGFDVQNLPPMSSGHFGLFGMRERAEKMKGRLTIESAPGKGTRISLAVPVAEGAPIEPVNV